MVVRRRFVTMEGEILDEVEWRVTPLHRCFYCNVPLLYDASGLCPSSFDGRHDLVTLVNR
jgi:hypothetical protein